MSDIFMLNYVIIDAEHRRNSVQHFVSKVFDVANMSF